MVGPKQDDCEWVTTIAAGFGLGTPREVSRLGGTASPKFAIRVPEGRFVVRVRHQEFAGVRSVQFDHASLERLAAAGLPVPCPQARSDGSSWMCHKGRTVEVLSCVDGGLSREGNARAIHELGVFLARFHQVLTTTSWITGCDCSCSPWRAIWATSCAGWRCREVFSIGR